MAVTIVTAGRDPRHAGNLIDRVTVAYQQNMEYAEQYGVDVEWIFVEWNPTEELISPTLADMRVKCYIIFNDLHTKIVHPDLVDEYNFMDGFANNVGARRASNEWTIITNNDTILGPNIWEWLRRDDLNPRVIYRAERRDVPMNVFGRSFAVMERKKTKVYSVAKKPRHAAGSFMLASLQEYPGYDERITDTNRHVDGHLCWNWTEHLGNSFEFIGKVYKADHPLVLSKERRKEFIPHKGRKRSQLGIIYTKPYDNTPEWGLPGYPEKEIGNNMWRIG